ncbi:MAG: HlyD family efflux transporter periplasmic adaptor subunit [Rhodobacteraceae bacterium]|nr:HlyD family efflux transporter periplasmic adaptor subunit [Paracoccaceae bacterium]
MHFLRRSLTGVLLFALTFGALGWAGTSVWRAVDALLTADDAPPPNREVVLAVNAVTVVPGRAEPVLETFGEVLSNRTLDVRATAPGKIVDLADAFRNGGQVAEGALLALIDPAVAEADLALARADLAEAQADMRDALRGLELAKDELSVAEEQADLRAQALTRQQDLAARGVGSASAVETAALAAAQARQSVVSRRQAAAQAETRIDQTTAKRDRMQIALAEAERRLADTQIRARFGGVLSDVSVVEGGLVATNERLARLVDPSALDVGFRLSTTQYARLLDRQGQLRRAEVDVILEVEGMDLVATGVIERESAEVGVGQTGRQIFARLKAAQAFRPGDIVTVRVREPAMDGVARLPARAVGSDGMVLVIGDDARLRAEPVTLVRRQGDSVLVRAPDLAGQQVVAQRTPVLGAGIKVRVLEAPADAEAPEPMVTLTPEHRARLIAAVEDNRRMPAPAKERVLAILESDQVPARVIERIESRTGG